MKTRFITALLVVSGITLVALTWAVRRPQPPATDGAPAPVASDPASAPPGPAAKAPGGAVASAQASPQPVLGRILTLPPKQSQQGRPDK